MGSGCTQGLIRTYSFVSICKKKSEHRKGYSWSQWRKCLLSQTVCNQVTKNSGGFWHSCQVCSNISTQFDIVTFQASFSLFKSDGHSYLNVVEGSVNTASNNMGYNVILLAKCAYTVYCNLCFRSCYPYACAIVIGFGHNYHPRIFLRHSGRVHSGRS